jgi:hypothetical protein
MTGQRFCAVESLEAGDPLPGTGTHPQCNLLISWPRKTWSRSLRIATDMAPALVDQIETLVAGGRRVNLIHRRGWPENRHRLYLFPENLWLDVDREALPELLDALANRQPLTRWSPESLTGGLILCCTHGKKDKCCAKFGYRTYQALAKESRKQQSRFEVWESSHLGGCRLAASVIVFPALRKYGRISEQDVAPLIAYEATGRSYLPCYRGSGRLTPAQQCAEIAVLERLEVQGIGADLEIDDAVPQPDGAVVVPVSWRAGQRSTGQFDARCETREISRVDTCADLDEGPSVSECWFVSRLIPR